MTDEPDNMILRYLPRADSQLDNLAERLDDLSSEVRGIKTRTTGFMQDHVRHDEGAASLRARLARIERRLDIQEDAS